MSPGHRRLFVRLWRALALAGVVTLAACGQFQKQADAKFGDQNFKTAISLIELHKVRFGEYPRTLQDLQFVGDWDKIALSAVEYARVDSGYSLDVTRGWVGKPTLHYSSEFWHGLGLRRTNMNPELGVVAPQ